MQEDSPNLASLEFMDVQGEDPKDIEASTNTPYESTGYQAEISQVKRSR